MSAPEQTPKNIFFKGQFPTTPLLSPIPTYKTRKNAIESPAPTVVMDSSSSCSSDEYINVMTNQTQISERTKNFLNNSDFDSSSKNIASITDVEPMTIKRPISTKSMLVYHKPFEHRSIQRSHSFQEKSYESSNTSEIIHTTRSKNRKPFIPQTPMYSSHTVPLAVKGENVSFNWEQYSKHRDSMILDAESSKKTNLVRNGKPPVKISPPCYIRCNLIIQLFLIVLTCCVAILLDTYLACFGIIIIAIFDKHFYEKAAISHSTAKKIIRYLESVPNGSQSKDRIMAFAQISSHCWTPQVDKILSRYTLKKLSREMVGNSDMIKLIYEMKEY